MKIHPLFEAVMNLVETSTSPSARDVFDEWVEAGKPVVEEEKEPHVWLDRGGRLDLVSVSDALAAKDARIRQLEEEREAWRRNVIPTSNSEAWKSGLISCASEMPCQKRIKELEADAASWEPFGWQLSTNTGPVCISIPAHQGIMRMGSLCAECANATDARIKELEEKLAVAENRPREIRCCRLDEKDADEIRNAALEEAIGAVETWEPIAGDPPGVQEDIAARVRGLKKP